MKKIIYLLMAVVIFAACKDPDVGPGEPQEDAGFIQFESPAVGQKSSYIHFYADGYWEATTKPIKYTRDTISWEITKKIDINTFEITERLSGELFGTEANNRVLRTITLVKDADKVRFTTDRAISSPLLGHSDTLELLLNNSNEIPYTDWKITENNSSQPFYGYLKNYNVKDKGYDRLDMYSDFTPTHYDGTGLMFAYNSKYGIVRYYGMNPWVGDVSGFDLIRDLKKPTDELKDFVGTKWRLKNVYYKDGSTKSINEIIGADNVDFFANSYTIEFKSDNELLGLSGCNSFQSKYKINANNIKFDLYGSITEMGCPFTSEFVSIFSLTTTFKASENTLILNSDYEEYSGLEFERVYEPEIFQLENTEWVLYKVHYNNGDVVPIDRLLGNNNTNPSFNNFELKFMENNLLEGFSGCNTFGGEYKVEKSKINIIMGNTTFVACKFTDEYSRILSNSTTYSANRDKLIINSSFGDYKALEFGKKFR